MRIVLYPSYIFFKQIDYSETERVKELFTHMAPGHWFAPTYKNWKQYQDLLRDIANGTFKGTPIEAAELKIELSARPMWDGRMSFYNYYKKTLPIGLLGDLLLHFQVAEIEDLRRLPLVYDIDFEINKGYITKKKEYKELTYRFFQLDAIAKAIAHPNGIFHLAVNAGKTFVFVMFGMIFRRNKVLILVDRKLVLNQIIQAFKDYVNMDVGYITSEDGVKLSDMITVAMIQTLDKKQKELSEWLEGVNVLLIDECHHAASDTYVSFLKKSRASARYGFSGTIETDIVPFRKVIQYLGPVLGVIDSKTLIDLGISVPPRIHVVRTLSSETDNYVDSIDQNVRFNRDKLLKIVNIVDAHKGKKILITTDVTSLGQVVSNILDQLGHANIFFHGGMKERENSFAKIISGEIKIAVATTILDEGANIEDLDVIILAYPRKSYRQTFQRIGRGMRTSAGKTHVDVFDFLDETDFYLYRQFRQRLEYYRKEQFHYEMVEEGKYENPGNKERLEVIDREFAVAIQNSSNGDSAGD